MAKIAHAEFKYFYITDSEGGCEQETGRTVQKFDTVRQALDAAQDDIKYMLHDDAEAVASTNRSVMRFRPGNAPREVLSGHYSNGGEDDDWLEVDFRIVYTNVWEERVEYDV